MPDANAEFAASSSSIAPGNEPTASVVMGRYAFDVFGQQTIWRNAADVAKTKDADHPLALVDHRQPADFQFLHVPHRLVEVIILPTAMDAGSHHIARGRQDRSPEPALCIRCRDPSPSQRADRSLRLEWLRCHVCALTSRAR